MRRVTMIGGPLAGETIETKCSKVQCVAERIGIVTYYVRRVQLGRMAWYVGTMDATAPVAPFMPMLRRPSHAAV